MKVVVAMDSFKGSLTSMEAGMAVRDGILSAREADVVVRPLADGGEGTTAALVEGLGGTLIKVRVSGPLGKPVDAQYGILEDGRTAVMEIAAASGITLIDRKDADPWNASTTGVGEMILDAVRRGCREFLIGLGGSATTEGGIGMLEALGYEFYDESGFKLPPVLSSLGQITRIEAGGVSPELMECRFRLACDVTNPLCGKTGAVCIFGPQKGLKEQDKKRADAMMRHYAEMTDAFTGRDYSHTPGAGAAGGLGFAFLSYLPNAELTSGIDLVLDAIGLEKDLADADIVVTGEGRLDAQTAMGKAPAGVACRAKKYGCRVIAFAGSVAEDAAVCNEIGIDDFFPTLRAGTTLEEAMEPETAEENIRLAAEQVFRLL